MSRRLPLVLFIFALLTGVPAQGARLMKIAWEKIPGAAAYVLEISGEAGRIIAEQVPGTQQEWQAKLEPGVYHYRLRAIDVYGRPGSWSVSQVIKVSAGAYRIAAGGVAGVTYLYPTLHLQRILDPHWAAGLLPFYFSGVQNFARVEMFGGFLTADAYLDRLLQTRERGALFLEAGLGIYQIAVPFYDESALTPAGLLLLRYRDLIGETIEVSVGLGAQYVKAVNRSDASWTAHFSGLLPVLAADIGFAL